MTLIWFKSSYSSGPDGDSCVEVAVAPTPLSIHIRDSKLPDSPTFQVAPTAWTDFVAYAAE